MKIINYENNFEELTKKKVLVDFFATWCGPCKMLSKEIESINNEIDIDIIKVDIDEYAELARKHGVMSVPTLILMEDNKEIKKNIGFIPKEEIIKFVK